VRCASVKLLCVRQKPRSPSRMGNATLQKSMLFTPLLPSAGPTGGEGDACPAPTISLTIWSLARAFFAMLRELDCCEGLQSMASHEVAESSEKSNARTGSHSAVLCVQCPQSKARASFRCDHLNLKSIPDDSVIFIQVGIRNDSHDDHVLTRRPRRDFRHHTRLAFHQLCDSRPLVSLLHHYGPM
jgi:hypothetical protein